MNLPEPPGGDQSVDSALNCGWGRVRDIRIFGPGGGAAVAPAEMENQFGARMVVFRARSSCARRRTVGPSASRRRARRLRCHPSRAASPMGSAGDSAVATEFARQRRRAARASAGRRPAGGRPHVRRLLHRPEQGVRLQSVGLELRAHSVGGDGRRDASARSAGRRHWQRRQLASFGDIPPSAVARVPHAEGRKPGHEGRSSRPVRRVQLLHGGATRLTPRTPLPSWGRRCRAEWPGPGPTRHVLQQPTRRTRDHEEAARASKPVRTRRSRTRNRRPTGKLIPSSRR